MKVIGYIRVSTEEQAREGISLEAQEAKIKSYVELHNLGEVEIIRDEGKSGKDLNREGIQEILRLAKEKRINHLIVYKLDRLTRRTLDLLTLIEEVFKPNNVEIHSITEKIDTSTAQGKFFLTIIGALSQMERDLISERTREALRYKISQGEPVGSPPLGYIAENKRLSEVEEELEIIRYIKKLRRKKLSLRQIANRLNEQSIPTKRGGTWYAGTVRYILLNGRYKKGKIWVSV
ncbi:MAG TPA: recombinase family protein [Candidatus Omnitrophica bacterium]|nr:recombinase family protein [Candidatus Omnitrophota bacterium]